MSTERKYLALHDELTSVFNNEIVVKKKQVEGTTLLNKWNSSSGQITVKMSESSSGSGSLSDYNMISYDSNNNTILLFRTSPKTTSTTALNYAESPIDTYCNESFYNGLSSGIKSLIKPVTIKYANNTDTTMVYTVTRKCFIPSAYEICGESSIGIQDGDFIWDQNRYSKSTGSTWWLRSPYRTDWNVKYIYGDGSLYNNDIYYTNGIRIAFWMSADALVDSNNIIQPAIIEPYESTELDTVRVDDKKYKLKDLEARTLISGKYTKPTTGIPASDIAEGVIPNISTKADLVDGKVPASQLPSYVDDVLEFASLANFPETGEEGKIYVTKDTNFTYRWSGTTYVKLTDVDLTNYYTKTETDTQMSGKANITHTHTKSQITDFAHNHDDRYYTETETNTLLSGKAPLVHNHDDRYYTETETNTLLAGKQNTLTAGENITIENNVISASGGSGGVIVHLTEDGEGNISCDTSIATIKGYYDAEKLVYCQDANGIRLPLVMATSTVVSFAVGGADGSHDDVMNGLSYIGIISDTTDTWIFLQATLDGKMTEIYNSSTSKSKYTPSELKDMMESNTAMTYNGITILKSEMFNSKFYFYFLDNYNIEKYEVDASKNVTRVTQRVLVDDNELSGAIIRHNSNNSAHSSLFNGKANVNHTHNGNDVSYSTSTYYNDGTVGKAISGKADAVHNHDDRYYTESEVDTKLGAKQDTLTAGTNITIKNNVISATGGSDKLDKANPVGTGSFSMNRKSGTTIGDYSAAEGYNTEASADSSHAEGEWTTASGWSSHAEGFHTKANGKFSHAEGNYTTAKNQQHVSGIYNYSLNGTGYEGGTSAINMNYISGEMNYTSSTSWNDDNGWYLIYFSGTKNSKVEHIYLEKNIDYTLSNNNKTLSLTQSALDKASSLSSISRIVKQLNPRNPQQYLHIVGNGLEDDNSNAYALSNAGVGRYAGDIYVNCEKDSSGGKKLATEEYVNSQKELPASLGTAGQVLKVNSGATGVEWGNAGGGGNNEFILNFEDGDNENEIICDKTLAEIKAADAEGKTIVGYYMLQKMFTTVKELDEDYISLSTISSLAGGHGIYTIVHMILDDIPVWELIHKDLSDGGSASSVTYDNTTSGLEATNVQDAIDEQSEKIVNLSHDYSTTEFNTGRKWIDGSTIYEKTYIVNSIVTGGYHSVSLGLASGESVDTFINYSCLWHFTENNKNYYLPIAASNIRLVKEDNSFEYEKEYGLTDSFVITIQYTKTSNGGN